MEIREVLDFRQRQHPHVRITLREAENHGLIEERVEHAAALEDLVEPFGDRIDAALLRHILAEQQRLGVFRQHIVQGLVDLDRQMPRGELLGQLRLAAEHRQTRGGIIGALGFGRHRGRRIGRQRLHDLGQRPQPRTSGGSLRGREATLARFLVPVEQSVLGVEIRGQRDVGRAQQRIAGLHGDQFLDAAPLDFEIGARVSHETDRSQMQERGSARGSTVLHRALHLRIAAGQVEAIRKKIVEVGAVSEIALDPARGCLHRDAEPIVFAHEQHRRGQFLVGRPGGRIERRLRAGVVGRAPVEARRDGGCGGARGPA